MRLRLKPLLQFHRQPRLADPRLAREQHHPPVTTRSLPPAAQQQLEFFVATNQRRGGRAQCFEPAVEAARAEHPPCRDRLGKTIERDLPKVVVVEQVADKLAGARRYHDSVGLGDPFQATGKLRSLADNHLLIRAVAEEIADHDGAGGDADAQLKRSSIAAIKLGDRLDQGETRTDRAFDVVLVCLRMAEMRQHLSPGELAHHAAGPRDDRRAAALVSGDQRLQLLRIKSGCEGARAGKVADKHRDLPTFGRARRYWWFNLDLAEGPRRSIGA